jgi:hypothetical protein
MAPCAFAEDAPSPVSQYAHDEPGAHLLYFDATSRFGGRRMDEAAFASQKVFMFDLFDRHAYKRMLFHAYPAATQPLLFFDGQVTMRKTGDADKGWHYAPNVQPPSFASPDPTYYHYYPGPSEPPTLSGAVSDVVIGYYRWTRNGLRGVDFGGRP